MGFSITIPACAGCCTCYTPEFSFRVIAGYASKCGQRVQESDAYPDRFFRTVTTVQDFPADVISGPCGHMSCHSTQIQYYCGTGTDSIATTLADGPIISEGSSVCTVPTDPNSLDCLGWIDSGLYAIDSRTFTSDESSVTVTYNPGGNITASVKYENEYTAAELHTAVYASLPTSYSGSFDRDHTLFASLYLSVAGDNYGIQRLQTKLARTAGFPTNYVKVWVRKRFTPDSDFTGASDVLTDGSTYEWAEGEVTERTLPEITEADCPANGRITYEIKKYSCASGYEPGNPNADGSRPTPDTHPNGFPL